MINTNLDWTNLGLRDNVTYYSYFSLWEIQTILKLVRKRRKLVHHIHLESEQI